MKDGVDVEVTDQGTIVLFTLHSERAKEWVQENVETESWQWLGDVSFAVDHRMAMSLVAGFVDEGMQVDEW